MQQFKNILFVKSPVEHDQESLKRAALLAHQNQASLKVVQTMDPLSEDLANALGLESIKDAEQKLLEEETTNLEKWVKDSLDVDVTVTSQVLVGKPFIEIIRHVQAEGHDLVMKSAEGHIGYKERLLGSTDMNLIRKCPTPVWMIKPSPYKAWDQVLASVAPDSLSRERDALNDSIMQLATSLASSEKSTLHVAHAWKMAGEAAIDSRSTLALMSKHDVKKAVDHFRDHHRKALDSLLERSSVQEVPNEVHFVKGDAEVVIPKLAKEKEVDLIIMGTVGRTGIPGFFIGNTAEEILNQVNCSILTVKPKGFKSPVEL